MDKCKVRGKKSLSNNLCLEYNYNNNFYPLAISKISHNSKHILIALIIKQNQIIII